MALRMFCDTCDTEVTDNLEEGDADANRKKYWLSLPDISPRPEPWFHINVQTQEDICTRCSLKALRSFVDEALADLEDGD